MPAANKTKAPKGDKTTLKQTIEKTDKADYKKLFVPRKKDFGIGKALKPKTALNLYRYVKWPKYIRVQRQRRILLQRFSIPPAVEQFSKCADKQLAFQLVSFLNNYKPEESLDKKKRLREAAEKKAKGEEDKVPQKKKDDLVKGVNEVTKLIEKQQARLVVIAHDVDPIELVVFLPALCKKMNVPYCIIKSKSRLGTLVNRKTCSCVALRDVKKDDRDTFGALLESIKGAFNDRYYEVNKKWGGGKLSNKSQKALQKKSKKN